MSKRIEWVDIYKGIAILFVVIGHTNSPLGRYIYLFHMAAFFFISGYTSSLNKLNLADYTIAKFRALIIPFVTVNMLFYALRFLLNIIGLNSIFYKESFEIIYVKQLFLNLTTVDIGGATWFLIVLFETFILAKILNDISKKVNLKQWVVIVISFIILLYGYSLYKNKITYPYMFDLSFVSLFYFLAGNYFKNKNIFVTKINHLYAIPISIVIIFFFTNLHFVGVNWPTRSFSNPLINIVVSFSGIYLTYILSIALSKIKYAKVPLTYIGMRTMTVLTMHFLAFRVCFILFFLLGMTDYSQLQSLVPIPNNNHWVILTILSAGIVLMIDYIVQLNPYMNYFLFGRNNDKVNQKVKQVFIEEDVV